MTSAELVWISLLCERVRANLRMVNSRTRTRLRRTREMGKGRRRQRTELRTVFIAYRQFVCISVYVCPQLWSMASLWPFLDYCRQTNTRANTLICCQLQCFKHVNTVAVLLHYFNVKTQGTLFEDKKNCVPQNHNVLKKSVQCKKG